jgi:hypothetical protein
VRDAPNIARYDGVCWQTLGPSGSGVDGTVYSLTVFESRVVAGGHITEAGDFSPGNTGTVRMSGIASWDGTAEGMGWHRWPPGLKMASDRPPDGCSWADALTVCNCELFAGGEFNLAGGERASGIAHLVSVHRGAGGGIMEDNELGQSSPPANGDYAQGDGGQDDPLEPEPAVSVSPEELIRLDVAASLKRQVEVKLSTPHEMVCDLTLYDLTGRVVTTIARTTVPQGEHVFTWDGRTSSGRDAAPGVYFCALRSGKIVKTIKVVLVR